MQQDIEKTENVKRGIKSNTWTGLFFLFIGGILLMRQLDYPFPRWLFSWEVILITIGLFIGIRNKFRDISWLILILVGGIFLLDDFFPTIPIRHFALPGIVIGLGLLFLLAPGRVCNRRVGRNRSFSQDSAAQDTNNLLADDVNDTTLDIVSVFSGVKKRVLSKYFKGGEIVCIFGGCEVNLTNADFSQPIAIEVVQIFGGAKLLIPANWEIQSEVAAIFGGIEDKRPHLGNTPPEKILILKGTIIFGGIEVSSF